MVWIVDHNNDEWDLEWWNVTNGELAYRAATAEDAEFLCVLLNKVQEKGEMQ